MWLLLYAGVALADDTPSISLEDAERRAGEAAWSVKSAEAGVRSARAQQVIARSALLPTVQVQGGVQVWNKKLEMQLVESDEPMDCSLFPEQFRPMCDGFAEPIVMREQVTASLTVRAVQPLTGIAASTWQLRGAHHGVTAAESYRNGAVNQARYDAADAWFSALSAERQLEIARAQVASLQARVKSLEAAFQADAVLKNDLLQAQLGLTQAKQGVVQLQALQDTARQRLAMTMAMPGTVRPEAPPSDALRGEPPVDGVLVELALLHRPELLGLEEQKEAARAMAAAADWNRMPQVVALAQYQHQEGQSFGSEANTGFVGMNLEWNVWGWDRQRQSARIADFDLQRVEQGRLEAEAGVRLEVGAKRRQLVAATAAWQLAKDSVGAAEENLRLFQVRYDAGQTTMSDVLDAELALVRARSMASTSWYEARRAEEGLILAVGTDPWTR